jgi:hypothetical protein
MHGVGRGEVGGGSSRCVSGGGSIKNSARSSAEHSLCPFDGYLWRILSMEPALASDPLMVIIGELLNSGTSIYLAALFPFSQTHPGNVTSFSLGPHRDGGIGDWPLATPVQRRQPAELPTPFSPAASRSTAARCSTTATTRLCPTPPPSSLFSPRVGFLSFSCNVMATGKVNL